MSRYRRRTAAAASLRAGLLAFAPGLAIVAGCAGSPAAARAPEEMASPAGAPAATTAPPEFSITNLYDAFGRDRPGVTFDFGFAALIRYGELTILFDGGSDHDVFVQNAHALGVALEDVDIVVLSHNHPDHTGGIGAVVRANPRARVFLPADPFLGGWLPFDYMADREALEALPPEERYRPHRSGRVGIETSGPFPGASTEFVAENREIAPGARLIVTRAEDWGYRLGPRGDGDTGHLPLVELSLSLRSSTGEVLVVGCSHSTVEAIVRAAREDLDRPIDLLVGGYHLLRAARADVAGLAERLRGEHEVRRVAPAHCTGPVAFRSLRAAFGEGYVFAGLGARIPFAPPASGE